VALFSPKLEFGYGFAAVRIRVNLLLGIFLFLLLLNNIQYSILHCPEMYEEFYASK
jgi:hypothetical protein